MITRREFTQAALAASAIASSSMGPLGRVAAQGRLTQDELLKFDAIGNVTLVHLTDIHGQLMPLHFREPNVNVGVGEAKGLVPHITGDDFLKSFGIPAK